jgi:hypothetical protein
MLLPQYTYEHEQGHYRQHKYVHCSSEYIPHKQDLLVYYGLYGQYQGLCRTNTKHYVTGMTVFLKAKTHMSILTYTCVLYMTLNLVQVVFKAKARMSILTYTFDLSMTVDLRLSMF